MDRSLTQEQKNLQGTKVLKTIYYSVEKEYRKFILEIPQLEFYC